MRRGIIYAVGVGPGDPELITLKALKAIKKAAVIYCPKCERATRSLGSKIIRGFVGKEKEIVEISFPARHTEDFWKPVADEIYSLLRKGKNVAFVTEGDPLLFSSFAYVYDSLRERPSIKIEIIPGVSSLNASAAAAGATLASGSETVCIIPANYTPLTTVKRAMQEFDTIALFKVSSKMDELIAYLKSLERDFDVYLIERASTREQRVIKRLDEFKGDFDYFSTLLIRRKRSMKRQ